ncbi:unnamed protein product [Effrenium voratum]|uniref:Uncharacterized protein n=1 Tax=Effrenium voratum TaxID=2562239 RepID=A0AA36MHF8_9DINO|nr:unnamed protein product [Effrenium voratum]CAJ1442515.1 unnamed protein product [Effrenium voratum]
MRGDWNAARECFWSSHRALAEKSVEICGVHKMEMLARAFRRLEAAALTVAGSSRANLELAVNDLVQVRPAVRLQSSSLAMAMPARGGFLPESGKPRTVRRGLWPC